MSLKASSCPTSFVSSILHLSIFSILVLIKACRAVPLANPFMPLFIEHYQWRVICELTHQANSPRYPGAVPFVISLIDRVRYTVQFAQYNGTDLLSHSTYHLFF